MSGAQSLPFWKIQGAGNDFVVLDNLAQPLPARFDFARAALALCDRSRGIGGDGLLLLEAPDESATASDAAIRMRMWNPDGSEDMCGNGLRCIVRLAHRNAYVGERFLTQTLSGLRDCEVLSSEQIRVAMGAPHFGESEIPFARTPDFRGVSAQDFTLQIKDETVGPLCSLSTGSTHTVLWVDAATTAKYFEAWSPLLEHHAAFPKRTSIMWASVEDSHRISLRIWERGAGETLACGTGACATAVAAQIGGRGVSDGEGIEIKSRGGILRVQWQSGESILLTGPAQIVFRGIWRDGEALKVL